MDPETERQLAAMIMEEASRLSREAERDGVAAYFSKPNIRSRANPQFLHATVRSIQQSNRIVEVNEMWRRRNVELENERGQNGIWQRNRLSYEQSNNHEDTALNHHERLEDSDDIYSGDGDLKDEELKQFLQSRLKRGRGAVGSRIDETGPYLPFQASTLRSSLMPDDFVKDDWAERLISPQAGPSMPRKHVRDWHQASWKRKQRDSRLEGAVSEDAGAKTTQHRKEEKLKGERGLMREPVEKKKKKMEKPSKSVC